MGVTNLLGGGSGGGTQYITETDMQFKVNAPEIAIIGSSDFGVRIQQGRGNSAVSLNEGNLTLIAGGGVGFVNLTPTAFTYNGNQVATLEDTLTSQEVQALMNEVFYPAPAHTPASYFTFSDGALMGFSVEGQAAYDAGELTDIVLPSSYSLVPNDSFEAGDYEFYSFEEMLEFSENVGYNFSAQADGQPIIFIYDMDDLHSAKDFIDAALAAYGVLPVHLEPLLIIVNGDDYSVSSLGYGCFRDCTSLTSITLPNSVISLDDWCFNGCTSLTSITLPNSVTSLGNGCFYECSALTSITIPNSVTSLGDYCFGICTSLTAINVSSDNTIYKSIDGIVYSKDGTTLIMAPSSIVNVTIPEGVTSLGNYCFQNCTSLTSITLPNSVTSLGDNCFNYCSALTSITLPNSVTSLGSLCFRYCSALTSITLPNSVTSLGNYCFQNCTSLTSITLPNSVTSLGASCFTFCTALTSITLPNSVISLDDWCFNGCTSLTSITVQSSNCTLGDTNVFYNTNNCPIYVPAEALETYKVATNWSTYANRLQAIVN